MAPAAKSGGQSSVSARPLLHRWVSQQKQVSRLPRNLMLRLRPRTPAEMRQVSGVGDNKLHKYGAAFIAALEQAALDGLH